MALLSTLPDIIRTGTADTQEESKQALKSLFFGLLLDLGGEALSPLMKKGFRKIAERKSQILLQDISSNPHAPVIKLEDLEDWAIRVREKTKGKLEISDADVDDLVDLDSINKNPISRKFVIESKEFLGRINNGEFEISNDNGKTWMKGSKVHSLAYSLQNAGGGRQLPPGQKGVGVAGGSRQSGNNVIQTDQNAELRNAILSQNADKVIELRKGGAKADVIDSDGNSLLDLLDKMTISDEAKATMRSAILRSLNPTAPLGYMKPEAFHGTPWGAEVMESGSLKGGVNDVKGGSQSKEGQVFFSDRSFDSLGDERIRSDLRNKPRAYADGVGMKSSNAASRAKQHRLTQVILDSLDKHDLKMTAPNVEIEVTNLNDINYQEASNWLQEYLHKSFVVGSNNLPKMNSPLENIKSSFKLPEQITLKAGKEVRVLKGTDLDDFYRQSANTLQRQLENGKAPYLALVNQGEIVPIVFGFEKVTGLKYHPIKKGNKIHRYAFQSEDHPLSGSSKGGKLKEIEVRSLKDLATMYLSFEAKKIKIPPDVVIRIRAKKANVEDKLTKTVSTKYLDASQSEMFRKHILDQAAKLAKGAKIDTLSLELLQRINLEIRVVTQI
ncbi:hypothetical protein ACCC84_23355, partial [Serratia odorifera]|uniref:hypothetical protein n=1 Tax=Serratia odorifera TaxID=618 RepID=UPI003531CC3C